MFMIQVATNKCSIQTNFVHENPCDDLDDDHIVKLIVYMVKLFKKENPDLFKEKDKSSPGPKVKHTLSEMISLYVFATYRGHRSCRKIAEFLEDKSKACE